MKCLLLLALCGLLWLTVVCEGQQQYMFRNGEQVQNVLPSGDRIIVGTSLALYDIGTNNNMFVQLQNRTLQGPNRLLVKANEEGFSNLVLSCDSSTCFLAAISNFNTISWSVSSNAVLRSGTMNAPGLFALSTDSMLELLWVDDVTSTQPMRLIRGRLLNINPSGPPSDSNFMVLEENTEAIREENFRFHLEFSHNDFLYLVADRHTDEMEPLPTARVLRLCANDSGSIVSNLFRSYMELKLVCGSSASVITSATFVSDSSNPFGQPTLVISARAGGANNPTLICAYSLSSIDSEMRDKFDECNGGNGNAGFLRYGESQLIECRDFSMLSMQAQAPTLCRFPGDYQGQEVTGNLQQQLVTSRSYQSGEILTSLTTAKLEGNFYIFGGSNRGIIHQYAVNSSIEYVRDVPIDTTSEISHLLTSSDSESLFAITSNKIIRHSVDKCSLSSTCTECLNTGDTLCGWCTLRNSCVRRSNCLPVVDRSQADQTVFVTDSASQCPSVTGTTPSVVHLEQLTSSLSISVATANILNHGGNFAYNCIYQFNSSTSSSPAITTTASPVISNQSFSCPTPRRSEIPPIPDGTDHVIAQITIHLRDPAAMPTTPLATTVTPISFTDCSVHTSCASCRGSVVGMCLWCPLTFACVSDLGGNSRCPVKNGVQSDTPISSCTVNILPHPQTSDYLIHANHSYQQPPLQISSEGLDIFSGRTFRCRLCRDSGCEDVVKTTAASFSSSSNIVSCGLTILQFDSLNSSNPTESLTLQVLVNGAVVDNPNMASVVVYSCPYLGTNCAQCLTIQPSFNCRYCSNSVGVSGDCALAAEGNNECGGNILISSIENCDAPRIDEFDPRNGPTEGGTVISVTGNNLGTNSSHIGRVMIGNVNCTFMPSSYKPGVGFDCTTGPILSSLSSKPLSVQLIYQTGPITLESMESFSYETPSLSINPVTPIRGPIAGGTLIKVQGKSIGIGSVHSILIRNMDCPIQSVQLDTIMCLTPPVNDSSVNNIIKLTVDDFSTIGSGFEYTANPSFTSIEPQLSFISGGTVFTVHGENMNVVQEPRLIFYIVSVANKRKRQASSDTVQQILSEPCNSTSSMLTCEAPPINSTLQSGAMEVTIGLLMDGVTSLLDLNTSVSVYSDPELFPFASVLQFGGSQNFFLTIEGKDLVFLESQVRVLINPCRQPVCECTNVRVFSENSSIVCQMRDPQDLPVNQVLSVTVQIGLFSMVVGEIRISPGLQLIIYLVPALAFIIILCVVIFIVLFAVFYRKARQKDERYDQLMVELEKLESSVARECKLGFAELQTDLDELTGDVVGCRLPYHHLRTYLMATLFPGNRDHSVLQPLQVPVSREKTMQRALSDFGDLLNDRKILLYLIQTLEEQRSFTIRDKSVVGSLLIIILHNRMDYATDVLKKLLSQLIRKTVTNSNPKLLLRRTESIAEKMLTNWLTLCLHGYIMEHAGQPMYLLYRAVKNQLEKGPVDVITGEARYSLSEQKLIRQKVDVIPINATVETEDGLRVPVKLLDCDTISQAKEKLLDTLFKAAPVSQRPKLTEVDLEYLRSPNDSTILRDEDHTTVVEGGWKKINTLKHYWISDNASFRILRRKEHAPPGRAYDYLGSLISTHTRRQRALSEAEDGSRVWHLFKQVDSEDPRRSPFLNNKKLVSEIYLPRMLSTKSILQNFVDELFGALFSVNHPPPSPTNLYSATFPQSPGVQVPMGYAPGADTVPMAIKYLFDFLDEEAELHRIADPDVVHTWKNNALSLRFWVNMIKNPEFVFDINKSHTVDACLSVIAQAFIDGCSPAEMKLTIDSPTSKLLYNKEVQGYKSKVKKYYSSVKQMPKIPEDAMQHYLGQLSDYQCQQMKKVGSFEHDTALNELLRYATHYSNQFLHTLRVAGLQHRAQQFENILQLTQTSAATLL